MALSALALGSPSAAEDTPPPPTVERIELDEKGGRNEEALTGWAARCLEGATPADRAQAMARYVALATKFPSEADPWLVDALQRSGPGLRLVAGRRVVVALTDEALAGADPKRLAALFDAAELAVERLTGARPPVSRPTKADKRERDRAGRFLVAVDPLPSPLGEQAFETKFGLPDPKHRGLAMAGSVVSVCTSATIRLAANRRAQLFSPALDMVVHDVAVRQLGEPAAIGSCDEYRTRAKERYEADWAPACLPGEWMTNDEALAHLFFTALDAERKANRDPGDALRAFLAEPRRDDGWGSQKVASLRDMALEPLAVSFSAGFCDVFRQAGVLPVGRAFEEMKLRTTAEEQCREAQSLLGSDETRGAAARGYRNAADTLRDAIVGDEAIVEALTLEEKDDAKKARAAAVKMGLIEGFDFLAPLPETWKEGEVSAAQRLMPFAVATAPSRHPFKVKEPIEVSLKWDEAKTNPYEKTFERTPWGDKKGINWGGAAIAATKWKNDVGRLVRLRPCRGGWRSVTVLADGVPLDPWPDGSVLAPGAKGTEIVLASPGRLNCSVPWRDSKCVEADLAAVLAEKPAALALRPWAARRVAAVLPAITAALVQSSDADFPRDVVLLAPYRGGDAATCDAMLARGKGHPPVLAAYLDVCRGTRDAAVLDRLVALATAADSTPETLSRVQFVLDGALFRKVTEAGPALAALWERGRKWMASCGFAEAEEIRDLYEPTPGFRVVGDATAWGRACLAPSWNGGKGEGYLSIDLPEGPGSASLLVRWQGARLTLRGAVTDGKKTRPIAIDMPGSGSEKADWTTDAFDLGSIPRGRVVLALEDPCASGVKLDAIAIAPKPLE